MTQYISNPANYTKFYINLNEINYEYTAKRYANYSSQCHGK